MATNWERTDLIDENEQVVQSKTKEQRETLEESSGITVEEWEEQRVKLSKVTVTASGAEQIQKKEGVYVTMSLPTLHVSDTEGLQQLEKTLTKQLADLHGPLELTKDGPILIVGLGNKTITPDAVGPFVIDHLQQKLEDERSVPLILYAPGVTAQTGLETKDFIEALVQKVSPQLVIVIDALATRASNRLCRTIQLTNTGIHPGSGVGNERAEIAKETLGVPVTAIGVPTVVEATVLLADAVEMLFRAIAGKIQEKQMPSRALSVLPWQPNERTQINYELIKPLFGEWSLWAKEERLKLFEEILTGRERLIVTPKEVDIWLVHYAVLVCNALFRWTKQLS